MERSIVTLADARKVIAAAENKAAEIGQPMNIAGVDAGGNLVAHVRMDNAWIGSVMIFAGRIPLKRDGKVVGAVGVSGGLGEQDHAVAEAGVKGF